jgi:chromosome segregation ATPase
MEKSKKLDDDLK